MCTRARCIASPRAECPGSFIRNVSLGKPMNTAKEPGTSVFTCDPQNVICNRHRGSVAPAIRNRTGAEGPGVALRECSAPIGEAAAGAPSIHGSQPCPLVALREHVLNPGPTGRYGAHLDFSLEACAQPRNFRFEGWYLHDAPQRSALDHFHRPRAARRRGTPARR